MPNETKGLQTVRVKTTDLLAVMKTNREAHRGMFLKALDGYKEEVLKVLEERLADARKGKRVHQWLGLEEPADHTKDYDRVIRMLEMSVDTEVELTQAEFAQYVMDAWTWKDQFTETSNKYIK